MARTNRQLMATLMGKVAKFEYMADQLPLVVVDHLQDTCPAFLEIYTLENEDVADATREELVEKIEICEEAIKVASNQVSLLKKGK